MNYRETIQYLNALKNANLRNKDIVTLIEKTNSYLNDQESADKALQKIINTLQKIKEIGDEENIHISVPKNFRLSIFTEVPVNLAIRLLNAEAGRDSYKFSNSYIKNDHKIVNLQIILNDYVKHLTDDLRNLARDYAEPGSEHLFFNETDPSVYGDDPKVSLAIEKRNLANSYLKILAAKAENEEQVNEILSNFKTAYLKDRVSNGQHTFEKGRESWGMFIAKCIASILIIPVLMGMWKTTGDKVNQDVLKEAEPDTNLKMG